MKFKDYIFWETYARTKTYHKGRGVNVQQAFKNMKERRSMPTEPWAEAREYWGYKVNE